MVVVTESVNPDLNVEGKMEISLRFYFLRAWSKLSVLLGPKSSELKVLSGTVSGLMSPGSGVRQI